MFRIAARQKRNVKAFSRNKASES